MPMLPVLSKRKISALCTVNAPRKNKRKKDLDEAIIFCRGIISQKVTCYSFCHEKWWRPFSHLIDDLLLGYVGQVIFMNSSKLTSGGIITPNIGKIFKLNCSLLSLF